MSTGADNHNAGRQTGADFPVSSLERALAYLRRGWCVIPLRPSEKRPLIFWEQYQSEQPSEGDLRSWFTRWPDANIGIVTGRVSGLVVLDVDPGHGGEESVAKLEKSNTALPPTIRSRTGGGGCHVYFRHPGADETRNKVGFAPGLDLRGDGGYVAAPPSLHPSGNRYVWEKGCSPEERALAEAPRWLLDLVKEPGPRRGHPVSSWRQLIKEGVDEGQRNNTIASLTGHLLWHGLDPDVIIDLLLCWNEIRCRPPLPEEEVVRTVESIMGTHERHERDEI